MKPDYCALSQKTLRRITGHFFRGADLIDRLRGKFLIDRLRGRGAPVSDLFDFLPPNKDRGGKTYERRFDYARLNGQARAVWNAVKDGHWHSLAEISAASGAPEASASARLRDFRKLGLQVDRKRIKDGLFFYRVRFGSDEGETTKEQNG